MDEKELVCKENCPHYNKINEVKKGEHVRSRSISVFKQKYSPDYTIRFSQKNFGKTDDGRTLLIEMNDGFAIGCYGLDDTLYAKFLAARWAELTGTKDPWANDLLK